EREHCTAVVWTSQGNVVVVESREAMSPRTRGPALHFMRCALAEPLLSSRHLPALLPCVARGRRHGAERPVLGIRALWHWTTALMPAPQTPASRSSPLVCNGMVWLARSFGRMIKGMAVHRYFLPREGNIRVANQRVLRP